jgi:hypothetical protein
MCKGKKGRYLLFLAVLVAFYSCKPRKPVVVNRAFYYWQHNFNIYWQDSSHAYLAKRKATELYIKVLDVDWNEVNHAYPSSVTQFNSYLNGDSVINRIVQVVFITNKTMQKISHDELYDLSHKIVAKCKSNDLALNELQIDCDWTEQTKDNYFALLRDLKKEIGKATLSATIRLYQYKYRDKTGVPPVDYGMLMMYNMQNVKNYNTGNSIFDKDEAEKYIEGVKKYPIPLGFALPAFSWAVVYRDKKFYCMMRNIEPVLSDTCTFLDNKYPMYTVKDDYMYDDIFLRIGDEIKIESTDKQMLLDAADLARECENTDTVNVALFELKSAMKSKISANVIEEAYNRMR